MHDHIPPQEGLSRTTSDGMVRPDTTAERKMVATGCPSGRNAAIYAAPGAGHIRLLAKSAIRELKRSVGTAGVCVVHGVAGTGADPTSLAQALE